MLSQSGTRNALRGVCLGSRLYDHRDGVRKGPALLLASGTAFGKVEGKNPLTRPT